MRSGYHLDRTRMSFDPDYFSPTRTAIPPRAAPSPTRRFLPVLLLILGVLIGFAGYRVWIDRGVASGEPRAITPRGNLADDEKATIELFNANRSSVVFITTLRQG